MKYFQGIEKIVTIIVLFSCLQQNKSQEYIFKQISEGQGLAYSNVNCIAQDSKGFMYFGTEQGLHKYDGYKLTSVQEFQNSSIYNIEKAGNCFLVGTEKELVQYEFETGKIIPLLNNDSVIFPLNDIKYFKNKYILLAANKGFYVFKYQDGAFKFLSRYKYFKNLFKKPHNFKKIVHNGNDIWVATHGLVYRFRDINDTIKMNSAFGKNYLKLRDSYIRSLDYKDSLLYVISEKKLVCLNPYEISRRGKVNNQLHISLLDISKNSEHQTTFNSKEIYLTENDIWITSNQGLINLKRNTTGNFEKHIIQSENFNDQSLNSNDLTCLFVDRTKSLWIGTENDGINYFDLHSNKFHILDMSKSNIDRRTMQYRDMFASNDNRIWISLMQYGVLVRENNGELKHFYSGNTNNSYIPLNDRVKRIVQYDNNSVLICFDNGFDVVNNKYELVNRYKFKRRYNLDILNLTIDNYKGIWVVNSDLGINRYLLDGKHISTEEIYNWLKEDIEFQPYNIGDIHYDSINNCILFGHQRGFSKYNLNLKGGIVGVEHSANMFDSLANIKVRSIYQKSKNEYLFSLINDKIKYVKFNNLRTNINEYEFQIFDFNYTGSGGILVDADSNIWTGRNGISRLNPKTGKVWAFNNRDGLLDQNLKSNMALKLSTGQLFFGGVKGIVHFNPANFKRNDIEAEVTITNISVNGTGLNTTESKKRNLTPYVKKLVLPYNQNNLQFDFSALHYANSVKCKYTCILENYDEKWNEIVYDKIPSKMYLGIKPGKYTLKVKASNNDGLWSDKEAVIDIVIRPPLWKSWQAAVIYFLIIMLCMVLLIRWLRFKTNIQLKEELHQTRLQFFTNISHEFKSPLSLIISLVEDVFSGDMKVLGERDLKGILHNSKRLLNLVNELIDFRKTELKVLTRNDVQVEINDFVRGISNNFYSLSDKKMIDFDVDVTGKLNAWVDLPKLEKVVFNLLSNAFKHTAENGKVQIKVLPNIADFKFPSGWNMFTVKNSETIKDYYAICISDTGVGIDKEELPRIFNQFYQASNKATTPQMGSGIGLALVRSLIEFMNGEISVASMKNKGTMFVVKLPKESKKQVNTDLDVHKDNARTQLSSTLYYDELVDNSSEVSLNDYSDKKKVLVIDDDDEIREYIESKLISSFKIELASNGTEALKMIKENMPDVIITDLSMPEMDGITFIKNVKKDVKTSHIPIITLTSNTSVDDRIKSIKAGADYYMAKPFNVNYLMAVCNNLITNRERMHKWFNEEALFDVTELVKSNKDNEFINEVFKLIFDNIDKAEINSEFFCEELGMSRSNLHRKIKAVTDLSISDLLRTIRLKTAAKILLTEETRVSDAAIRVGIQDNAVFSKAFKKHFGLSPKEYVKKYSSK
ncbi:MAG: response regulator [Bacteroidales bacterium]|nr:response regulator [Bacteroidales bacterium]